MKIPKRHFETKKLSLILKRFKIRQFQKICHIGRSYLSYSVVTLVSCREKLFWAEGCGSDCSIDMDAMAIIIHKTCNLTIIIVVGGG